MKTKIELPDFDALVALHRNDPVAYENFRTGMLQRCVAEAPAIHQPKLSTLIKQMDGAREKAASPLEAAVAAASLMIQSVDQLRTGLVSLLDEKAALETKLLLAKLRLAR